MLKHGAESIKIRVGLLFSKYLNFWASITKKIARSSTIFSKIFNINYLTNEYNSI